MKSLRMLIGSSFRWPVALLSLALFWCGATGTAEAISSRTLISPAGAAGDLLGNSVADAGDVNGDGYDDVIVGAPHNNAGGPSAGRAYVYYGGPSMDAVADLTLTGAASGDNFGISVSGAGDVNGDGYDDVIVGAYFNDAGGTDAGRAYVYYGGPSPNAVADLALTGASADNRFGISVSGAGDVNGDGYADVIVGAQLNDAGGTDAGQAYVYYGGSVPNAVADLTLTGAAASDFFGTSVSGAGDVNGDGYADVIVGADGNDAGGADAGRAYVYYGGPGTDAIADLTLTGAAATDLFGISVSGAGDVNGDGYADVVVGAYQNDAGGGDAGRAYVYYGGPGADAVADLTLTGAVGGDQFGTFVAGAGDVNGDGYRDVIVGAPGNDAGGTTAGRAYAFFGGPAPDAIADLTLTGAAAIDNLGISVSGAGDVNGDGYGDVVAGAYINDTGGPNSGQAYVVAVYPYKVVTPNGGDQWVAGTAATVRWRGHDPADLYVSADGGGSWSLVAAGVGGLDDNELTITAPGPATDLAKVRLTYSGQVPKHLNSDTSDGVFHIVLPVTPPSAAARLQSTFVGSAFDDFGVSVSSAGDVNGDGYGDVIVGADLNDAGGTNAGRAYVFYGGPGADAVPDLTLTGAAGDNFGNSVSGAGDVNGDGYGDVIVGAYRNSAAGTFAGRAYVYYGGPGADAVADLTFTGAAASDFFGNSVSGAGDVNGDGYDDVIVGAYQNGTGAGRAYVYFGGPGADAVADLTPTGASGENLGVSVSAAGDVNGDGYGDVIAGAYFSGVGGRAYVYYGGPGADALADLTLTGASASGRFGSSVSSAGDVNGDGFGDVIVGAFQAGATNQGQAYVYYGAPGADAVADLTLTGAVTNDQFGQTVSGAVDVNGDGYSDVIVGAQSNGSGPGRAYVYYGGPGADALADRIVTGVAVGDGLGVSVAGAGDVNGDGFGDVIVGAPYNGAGGSFAGAAYVYDFKRYFVVSPNGGETWNVGASKAVSWLGAEPASLWLSTDGGATYQLLESSVGGGGGGVAASNSVTIRVPHTPTKFARLRVSPASASVGGSDASDSLFTIRTDVTLLSLLAAAFPGGGIEVSWATEPGPADLGGYRLERGNGGGAGGGWTTVAPLITEARYVDASGAPGSSYRLYAVNGFGEELFLGEAMVRPLVPLSAWPTPYRGGGELSITFATSSGVGGGLRPAEVDLYDVRGRLVRRITNGEYVAGYHRAVWDGRDARGGAVASGVYFLVSRSAGEERRLKLVIAR